MQLASISMPLIMQIEISDKLSEAQGNAIVRVKVNKNWVFITLILLTVIPLNAHSLEYPNRYNSMAETLFDMMDAFSSAYQRRRHERDNDNYGAYATPPGYSPYYGETYPYPSRPYGPQKFPLNGSWQGEGGEILVIRNQQFRIYLDRDNYLEGRLQQIHPQMIVLQDLQTGQARPYQFAESKGRLILLDPSDNLLRYIRIGW
jgi:hypothetical protein